MELLLRTYIKQTFDKNVSETATVGELLAFIVNFSYSEGYQEGYQDGSNSQQRT